jgi:YVTN family beta-propeller protein
MSALLRSITGEGSLSRISRTTNGVLSVLPLTFAEGFFPSELAVAEGSLWLAEARWDASGQPLAGSVRRIDPTMGTTSATIAVGRSPGSIAASPGALWVANYSDGTVSRIDPVANQVVATVTVGGEPRSTAYGEGAVWVANGATGQVHRIDPATNQFTSIQTQATAYGVAVGGGAVWVSYRGIRGQPDGLVSRIDPVTNQVVARIPVGVYPGRLVVGGGSLWVAMQGEATVVRITPSTNSVTARIGTGVTMPSFLASAGIAASDYSIWVVNPAIPPAEGPGWVNPPPGTVIRINF